jgi:hypothetical protein
MINKFKIGLTAQEAALLATNLERFDSLFDARNGLNLARVLIRNAKVKLSNSDNDDSSCSMSLDDINTHEADFENLDQAEKIYQALLDEAHIACVWHDHLSGEDQLYLTDISPLPTNNTHLEVFQISRIAPDDEYPFYPIPNQTTLTKVSLAKWFYIHLPEKANLFDSTESYKTIETGYSTINHTEEENLNTVILTTGSQFNFAEKITRTDAWQDLYKLTERAVDAFPTWQNNQPKPNKIPVSHIDDWLALTQKITKREAETIKKIIVEIFNL